MSGSVLTYLSATKGKRPVVPVKRALEISETRQRTRRVVRDRHLPRFRYEWRHNTQHWPTVGPISPFNGRFLVTRNFGKRSLCSIGPLGPYTKLSLILWFGVAAITVVSSAVTVRRRGRQKLSPQSRVGTSKNMLTVQCLLHECDCSSIRSHGLYAYVEEGVIMHVLWLVAWPVSQMFEVNRARVTSIAMLTTRISARCHIVAYRFWESSAYSQIAYGKLYSATFQLSHLVGWCLPGYGLG